MKKQNIMRYVKLCWNCGILPHFSFMQSDLHRTEYWPKLTERLTGIGKGNIKRTEKDMYRILRPYLDFAIANAPETSKKSIKGKMPSRLLRGPKYTSWWKN